MEKTWFIAKETPLLTLLCHLMIMPNRLFYVLFWGVYFGLPTRPGSRQGHCGLHPHMQLIPASPRTATFRFPQPPLAPGPGFTPPGSPASGPTSPRVAFYCFEEHGEIWGALWLATPAHSFPGRGRDSSCGIYRESRFCS